MLRKLSLLCAVSVCLLSVPTLAESLEEIVKETVTFSSPCGSSNISAKVTSAVYQAGDEYIYAYQIFDVVGGEFSWFSVGLLNNPVINDLLVGDRGFLTPAGTVAPMPGSWQVSSAVDSVDALFMPNKIGGSGEVSQWLTFTSNWGPGEGIGALANLSGSTPSFLSGKVYIPIIPEPMTLVLLGAGALVLRKKRAN